jgi:alkaline phosphatase
MRPFATLVEAARLEGLSVGLVVTSSFTHATPAGFFSHVDNRDNHESIAVQGLHAGMDVVLGGGWGYLRPLAQGGLREDERDLTQQIEATGCNVVRNAEGMAAAQGVCLWGLFAEEGMTPVVDRPRLGTGEPTLAEMTRKAIDVLARNPHGFFLMVEGSQIDWAAHANDAGYLVRETVAFDEAVEVALDFARHDRHTLLLSTSDHSTGGLTIAGRKEKGLGAVDALLRPLRRMRCAAFRFVDRLEPDPLAAHPKEIQRLVREGWGLDISRGEARKIRTVMRRIKKAGNRKYAFGEVLSSKYLGIDWTSHDHSGGDVPLHAFGPGRPTGTLAMADIAKLCAASLGLDLEQATERLFADVRSAFAPDSVSIRTEANGGRTAVVALGQGTLAELPLDTSLLVLDGAEHHLEGLVFEVAPDGRLYAPRQAIELMRGYHSHPLED